MSADTRPQGPAARRHLRIYLSYAPGAGTTCALLSEGRRRAEHGTDVAVASAETHGRPHTEDLLAGLEVIHSTKVPYRGTVAEEMDLGAVALVDDFRAPHLRHVCRKLGAHSRHEAMQRAWPWACSPRSGPLWNAGPPYRI